MCVRENYFGNFTHFSTLNEYVYKREHNIVVGDPVESKWKEGRVCIFIRIIHPTADFFYKVQCFRGYPRRTFPPHCCYIAGRTHRL